MNWVLIMYFVGSQTMTLDHVEFKTKGACVLARDEMRKAFNYAHKIECFNTTHPTPIDQPKTKEE